MVSSKINTEPTDAIPSETNKAVKVLEDPENNVPAAPSRFVKQELHTETYFVAVAIIVY